MDHVLAVPGMLFAAGHVKNDVPSVLNAYAAQHGMRIEFGRDLGIEPKLLAAARDRIDAALTARASTCRGQTLLAVIGRGTSDPDANGNVAKVARMLWEGMGFGGPRRLQRCGPSARRRSLERGARLGFRRIVVFPYFLFTGVLVRRIYAQTDEVAARHPGIEFVKAGYLNDHPLVLDTFVERIQGITAGDVNMNCLLCTANGSSGTRRRSRAAAAAITITSRASARTRSPPSPRSSIIAILAFATTIIAMMPRSMRRRANTPVAVT